MATPPPKRILIAPLDWGLGHTTRCIPIIRYIISLGHIPVVACNSSQQAFIEETFSNIEIIHLNGYDITYSKWNSFGQIGLLSQLPHITKAIRQEYKWLQQHADDLKLDGVISDNRYGLFHLTIPSVIMTHQLLVQTGLGNLPDRIVQQLHYKYLNRFNATWVVDVPGTTNLGGRLSHPKLLPDHVNYIGLLSQFEGCDAANSDTDALLVLISGPEPQRTTLSKMLWQQVLHYNGKVIFVDGSDNTVPPGNIPAHITYYKRLTNKTLASVLQNAAIVICRSGYSSIMDFSLLRKRAILIPTPGQTEQEYLGKHLHENGIFYCTKQNGFDLGNELKKAAQFSYEHAITQDTFYGYKKIVNEWIASL